MSRERECLLMQLELLFSNERRVLPSVRAFAAETLRQSALLEPDAAQVETLVVGAVEDAVDHAYREGEEGSIKLTIRESHGRLEIVVRDYGMPQDVELLERRLHEPAAGGATLFGCPTHLFDEVHWQGFGPEGKALEVRKWLHQTSITDSVEAAAIAPFRDDAPPAPPGEYTVRRMRPDEAVQVSQLMYRAYGNTYFNPDVYYPQRVAAHDANGTVVSFVAATRDGYVAGHSALELNQPGPVAESGQAVVDPAHRGRGLLGRMKAALLEEAVRRDLAGWYADAVAVHTLTQKSNADHGGCPSCADLGISPKTEQFRGLAAVQPQRVSCLLYFHWLKGSAPRRLYVPARHRQIVAEIYAMLECPVSFGEPASPAGHGTLALRIDPGAATAFARAEKLGIDTVQSVRHAKREAVERSLCQAVFVELPVEDPAAACVVEGLEKYGFAFAGVAPHFSARGDLLRMIYLVEPLAREPVKTYDAPAGRLVDYALAEQARVVAAL
jgi:anti-sigma regulatory factor (Ser/Thr protein kinase)